MTKTRIAIVEDDSDDREFISMALENAHDLEVNMFPTANDFLRFMKDALNFPHLVITDLRMPIISGFDVIRILKEDQKTRDIPVVVLSTSSNKEDINRAIQLGASAFYVKPYNLTEYQNITQAIVQNFHKNILNFSGFLKKTVQIFRLPLAHSFLFK